MSNQEAIREALQGPRPPVPLSGFAVASISLGALTLLPAIAALLVGQGGPIAYLIYYLIVGAPAVLAIVFGIIAHGPTKRGERRGYAMAAWGSFLGFFGLIAPYIGTLLGLSR